MNSNDKRCYIDQELIEAAKNGKIKLVEKPLDKPIELPDNITPIEKPDNITPIEENIDEKPHQVRKF